MFLSFNFPPTIFSAFMWMIISGGITELFSFGPATFQEIPRNWTFCRSFIETNILNELHLQKTQLNLIQCFLLIFERQKNWCLNNCCSTVQKWLMWLRSAIWLLARLLDFIDWCFTMVTIQIWSTNLDISYCITATIKYLQFLTAAPVFLSGLDSSIFFRFFAFRKGLCSIVWSRLALCRPSPGQKDSSSSPARKMFSKLPNVDISVRTSVRLICKKTHN